MYLRGVTKEFSNQREQRCDNPSYLIRVNESVDKEESQRTHKDRPPIPREKPNNPSNESLIRTPRIGSRKQEEASEPESAPAAVATKAPHTRKETTNVQWMGNTHPC